MKDIIQYIRQYLIETDKRVLTSVSIFTAILIFINYHFHLNRLIEKNNLFIIKLFAWFAVFLVAFSVPYLIYCIIKQKTYIRNPAFLFLLIIAPGIFALKYTLDFPFHFLDDAGWNKYWGHLVYWPLLAIITGTILYAIWKMFDDDQPFYGISTKTINWRPYWMMLLIMLPLIAAASTQADFQAMYPKLKMINGIKDIENLRWWHLVLFELSYGSDFITIELFFRGFLVLAFIKWAGKDAILPMACFYCTIHFGKPLGECISSYFGGMLLGIVVYNTRSIFGGLLVHVGIAWMMELGGYTGNAV